MLVEVLGSVNMDIAVSTPSLPVPGETVTATNLAHFPGGKGANQAIAAARLGASTALIGAVGNDGFGAKLHDYLAGNGVDVTSLVTVDGFPTGQAYVCVADNGENSIVVIPGANHAITAEDLPAHQPRQRKVCLTQFEVPLDVIEKHWSTRHPHEVVTILNAAPAVHAGGMLFELADVIVVNEVELGSYAGQLLQTEAPEEIVQLGRKLITRDNQHVIVTMGARGATAISVSDWYTVDGLDTTVVDTTGAGDCFCGALAAALSAGRELRNAILSANAAAAISVGRRGAGSSMPSGDEVKAAMKRRSASPCQQSGF